VREGNCIKLEFVLIKLILGQLQRHPGCRNRVPLLLAPHFDCISGLEAPQINHVSAKNWKVQ
jgi:hypothetical protein